MLSKASLRNFSIIYARLKLVTLEKPGCDSITIENPPFKSVDSLRKISDAFADLEI